MKNKIEYNFLKLALGAAFLLTNIALFAQPPGGPPPGGGGGATGSTPPCWEPECIPIDGGIGFLLAAGVALGARKLYTQLK